MSGWLLLAAMCAQAGSEPDWSSWVLKVEVVRVDGVTELGSGVALGPDPGRDEEPVADLPMVE
jgi:hypothetical protein